MKKKKKKKEHLLDKYIWFANKNSGAWPSQVFCVHILCVLRAEYRTWFLRVRLLCVWIVKKAIRQNETWCVYPRLDVGSLIILSALARFFSLFLSIQMLLFAFVCFSVFAFYCECVWYIQPFGSSWVSFLHFHFNAVCVCMPWAFSSACNGLCNPSLGWTLKTNFLRKT